MQKQTLKTSKMKQYKIDKELVSHLNIATIKHLLCEADTLQSELLDSIKIITEKANDLFKLLVAVTDAMIGFLFTNPPTTEIKAATLYFILTFSYAIYNFYHVVYPKSNGIRGTAPRAILIPEAIGPSEEGNENKLLKILLQSKQKAIDTNTE